VLFATLELERLSADSNGMRRRHLFAGDINGFNLGYALALVAAAITATTRRRPHIMDGCGESTSAPPHATPGPEGRTPMAARIKILERSLRCLELYISEPNTFFFKPLIALAEKRASRLRFATSMRPPWNNSPAASQPISNRSCSWRREGPLLVHDGAIISNSSFMLEYISESFPGPALIPADRLRRLPCTRVGTVYALSATLGSSVPTLGTAKYLQPYLSKLDAEWLGSRIAGDRTVERRAGWMRCAPAPSSAAHCKRPENRLGMPLARIEKDAAVRILARRPSFLGG